MASSAAPASDDDDINIIGDDKAATHPHDSPDVTLASSSGLSFGTGQHPTTRFCLEELVAARRKKVAQSFLDMGTGSGILAIAALKLGYRPVEAFDFDPDAVRVAQDNARVNSVRLAVHHRDLTRLPVRSAKRFDIVCANLIYDLLIQERRRILHRIAMDGTLVLAGILQEQFAAVRESYEAEGMILMEKRIGFPSSCKAPVGWAWRTRTSTCRTTRRSPTRASRSSSSITAASARAKAIADSSRRRGSSRTGEMRSRTCARAPISMPSIS